MQQIFFRNLLENILHFDFKTYAFFIKMAINVASGDHAMNVEKIPRCIAMCVF